jgi:hypothetical protein
MSVLKPGVSVILTSEGYRGGSLFCKGSTYEVDDDRIIVSQTFPPLNKSRLNEQLSLTFLGRRKDRIERFGFVVEFLEIRTDYPIASDEKVVALVFERRTDLADFDMRMNYRMQLSADSGIEILFEEQKTHPLDLSLGGAQFSYSRSRPVKLNDLIQLILNIDTKPFIVKARVRRSSSAQENASDKPLHFAAVEFLPDRRLENELNRKLMMIQRRILAQGCTL